MYNKYITDLGGVILKVIGLCGGSGSGKAKKNSGGYYSGWSNQSLQNMANTGVAMYEKNKTTSGGSSKPKTTFSNRKKYVQ